MLRYRVFGAFSASESPNAFKNFVRLEVALTYKLNICGSNATITNVNNQTNHESITEKSQKAK